MSTDPKPNPPIQPDPNNPSPFPVPPAPVPAVERPLADRVIARLSAWPSDFIPFNETQLRAIRDAIEAEAK